MDAENMVKAWKVSDERGKTDLGAVKVLLSSLVKLKLI